MSGKTIVVFGATGQQGRWVCKAFKEDGWRVVGVSRSKNAIVNTDETRVGDLEGADSVAKASQGADVVYAVSQPWRPNGTVDEEAEKKQIESIVRGVAAAKVSHLIFGSIQCQTRLEPSPELLNIAHCKTKFLINPLAREVGVPTTVLGVQHYADNWDSPYMSIYDGQINGMMARDVKVAYTACRDVGRMALVAAKQGPPKDLLRYLPVWTDFVSGDELVRLLKLWHGKDFSYNAPPLFMIKFFAPEVAAMRVSFEEFGRQEHPNLEQMYETRKLLGNDYWTLEKWLIENGFDKKLKPVPPSTWKKILTGAIVIGATIAAGLALYWNR